MILKIWVSIQRLLHFLDYAIGIELHNLNWEVWIFKILRPSNNLVQDH